MQVLFIFYYSFLLNLWYSIEAGVFSRLHIIFRRNINGTEKKQLLRQAGIRPVRGGRVRRPWQYMEVSVSGSEIRRRDFPSGLYYSGADIWLYHDHCGDSHRQENKEEPGRRFREIRRRYSGKGRRLDQRHHPYPDLPLLFDHRRLGHQIPL